MCDKRPVRGHGARVPVLRLTWSGGDRCPCWVRCCDWSDMSLYMTYRDDVGTSERYYIKSRQVLCLPSFGILHTTIHQEHQNKPRLTVRIQARDHHKTADPRAETSMNRQRRYQHTLPDNGQECPICLDDIASLKTPPWSCDECNNLAHRLCMANWVRMDGQTCPLCRHPIEDRRRFADFQEGETILTGRDINNNSIPVPNPQGNRIGKIILSLMLLGFASSMVVTGD